MAFGKGEIRVRGKSTDDRNFGLSRAQQIEMPAAADAIADHAGHAHRGIEARKPAATAAIVRATPERRYEEHRRVEPLRELGGRAFIAGRRRGIEQAHHPSIPRCRRRRTRGKVATTASRSIIQPSRLCERMPAARS